MSKLKRGYQAGVEYYDPFPKTGRVKQHESFIRARVREFCKRYPRLRRDDVLIEAVRLASQAEQQFKPELGYKFTTFLGYPLKESSKGYLKGLHRLAARENKHDRVEIYELPKEKERREAEAKGEPTRAISFEGGGNGTRISFDHQWIQTTPPSNLAITYSRDSDPEITIPSAMTRHRVRAGVQLRNNDGNFAAGVMERSSPDVKVVLGDFKPGPTISGRMRAVIDHQERRQREMEEEAENRRLGSYDTVILTTYEQPIDIAFYKGRKPPRFEPTYIPVCRLDDAYSHDPEQRHAWKTSKHDVVVTPEPAEEGGQDELPLREAAEALRPSLGFKWLAVLDWIVNPRGRTLARVAEENSITKGYASKIKQALVEKLAGSIEKTKRFSRGVTRAAFDGPGNKVSRAAIHFGWPTRRAKK